MYISVFLCREELTTGSHEVPSPAEGLWGNVGKPEDPVGTCGVYSGVRCHKGMLGVLETCSVVQGARVNTLLGFVSENVIKNNKQTNKQVFHWPGQSPATIPSVPTVGGTQLETCFLKHARSLVEATFCSLHPGYHGDSLV